MAKNRKINVQGKEITIIGDEGREYISLTDMLKAKDGEFFISDWLRNRNTVEYLGICESVYNPDFNYGEFDVIKSQAGLNSYRLSVKEWVEKTNAIGLRATTGRYGGTYAHPDIAFEFGMWISPQFKIYLIKEFQRLKEDENNRLKLEWNLQRTLAKINYHIHTDAIKENLIPHEVSKRQAACIYADEADLLIRHCSDLPLKSGTNVILTQAAIYATMPDWNSWWCSAIWKASTPCSSNRDYRKASGLFSLIKRLLPK